VSMEGYTSDSNMSSFARWRHGMKVRIIRLAIGRLREGLVVADVNMEAAVHAGTFCHDSCQMHGVEIPDALIAATARIHGLKLVTRDFRHFPDARRRPGALSPELSRDPPSVSKGGRDRRQPVAAPPESD
jgi:hypothetical protein